MWVTIRGKNAVEIEDSVVLRVLGFYPEERLFETQFFQNCLETGRMSFAKLQKEAELIFLPWQLFFLDPNNLERQLRHIEVQREDKLSGTFFSKRKGEGDHTSRRIIDRLIRMQKIVVDRKVYPKNIFCGSLVRLSVLDATERILNHFELNMDYIRGRKNKGDALNYIITCVESKYVNVSRGVRALLPTTNSIDKIYKNTSGFVLKDERLPFLFLPGDINQEEATGRQIYSIFYLLVSIGLDDYQFFIDAKLAAEVVSSGNTEKYKHAVVSHILFPTKLSDQVAVEDIDLDRVISLSTQLKITPTATLVILRMRRKIDQETFAAMKDQLETIRPSMQKAAARTPKITTSINKFYGKNAVGVVNDLIKSRRMKSITAQNLLFGRVNKKQFRSYLSQI